MPNTADGKGKPPKPSKGRKVHGEKKNGLFALWSWFSNKSDPKGPQGR